MTNEIKKKKQGRLNLISSASKCLLLNIHIKTYWCAERDNVYVHNFKFIPVQKSIATFRKKYNGKPYAYPCVWSQKCHDRESWSF